MNQSQPPQPTSAPQLSSTPQPAGTKRKNKRLLLIIVSLVVVVVSAICAWWWFTKDNDTTINTAVVTITDNGFEPSTIKVRKGEAVTWTNQDGTTHHIYADQSGLPGLDSQEPLDKGDSYSFTFERTGTYGYYDSLHPTRLTGTVIVE
jgi:plastocyanin